MNNKEQKNMKRQYSERGSRREYNHVRIDADSHKELQELSEKLGLPIIEVMRLAIEKLKNEEKTDFQK
ncbi:hypothetical protein [Haliscomenobacter sp.]|uniref:hypothetical protein n=1 Tax=Haliscomenobacter sp. TaxID=2717303 RepID=UPI003BABDAB8